jgi:hypothetical protein
MRTGPGTPGLRRGCVVHGASVLWARDTVQRREGDSGCRKHGVASGSCMRRRVGLGILGTPNGRFIDGCELLGSRRVVWTGRRRSPVGLTVEQAT